MTRDFTPERRGRIKDEMKRELLAEVMPLHELRRARALTQLATGEEKAHSH